MNISISEFNILQNNLNDKEKRIAQLETELAKMKEERDMWQTRATSSCDMTVKNMTKNGKFIVISKQKLKSMLKKINDVKQLSLLFYVFQKILPNNTSAEDCKALSEIFPEPELLQPILTVEGDLKVEGNWNDIHNNHDVII